MFLCYICGYISNTQTDMIDHVATQHAIAPVICNVCNLKLTTTNDLEEHLASHVESASKVKPTSAIEDQNVPPEECVVKHEPNSPTPSIPNVLTEHEKRLKPYDCSICNYRTDRRDIFKRHAMIHDINAKVVRCSLCDFETTRNDSLRRHAKLLHQNTFKIVKAKTYRCSVCNFKTKRSDRLQRHSKIHVSTTSKIFKCESCGFRTNHKWSLQRHSSRCSIIAQRHELRNKDEAQECLSSKSEPKQRILYMCRVRDFKCLEEDDLDVNVKPASEWVCGLCNLTLPTESELVRHFEIH